MKNEVYVLGLGHYVPEKVLTNQELEKRVETSDEWITTRTGIKERRIADGQTCSDLALEASKIALAQAQLDSHELTHIIVATFTPDSYIPSAAATLQAKLGVSNIPCMDVSAACTGFLYGLEVARCICKTYAEAKVLVVASEIVTSRTNFADRRTCVLFGDGAGAVILGSNQTGRARVVDILLHANGKLGDLLTVTGGGSSHPPQLGEPIDENYFVQMQGQEVFKYAVRYMANVCKDILVKNNLSSEQIDLFVPHQANVRIIDALRKKLELDPEKVFVNVQNYGNTSAASVPLALSEAYAEGKIKSGDKVLMVAFGGGFTWGSSILQF